MIYSDDESPADRRRRRLLGLVQALDETEPLPADAFDPWAHASAWHETLTQGALTETPEARSVWGRYMRLSGSTDAAQSLYSGPLMASPKFQFLAASRCLRLREEIESGTGAAVLAAVAQCAAHALPLPGWLAAAYLLRYERVASGECKGWSAEDAYGSPREPGENAASAQARAVYGPWAYELALQLIADDPSRPIDRALYEEVGCVIGRSAARVQVLIREHLASEGDIWPPLVFVKQHCKAGGDRAGVVGAWFEKQHGREYPITHTVLRDDKGESEKQDGREDHRT